MLSAAGGGVLQSPVGMADAPDGAGDGTPSTRRPSTYREPRRTAAHDFAHKCVALTRHAALHGTTNAAIIMADTCIRTADARTCETRGHVWRRISIPHNGRRAIRDGCGGADLVVRQMAVCSAAWRLRSPLVARAPIRVGSTARRGPGCRTALRADTRANPRDPRQVPPRPRRQPAAHQRHRKEHFRDPGRSRAAERQPARDRPHHS